MQQVLAPHQRLVDGARAHRAKVGLDSGRNRLVLGELVSLEVSASSYVPISVNVRLLAVLVCGRLERGDGGLLGRQRRLTLGRALGHHLVTLRELGHVEQLCAQEFGCVQPKPGLEVAHNPILARHAEGLLKQALAVRGGVRQVVIRAEQPGARLDAASDVLCRDQRAGKCRGGDLHVGGVELGRSVHRRRRSWMSWVMSTTLFATNCSWFGGATNARGVTPPVTGNFVRNCSQMSLAKDSSRP